MSTDVGGADSAKKAMPVNIIADLSVTGMQTNIVYL
jgi:hypothetical protein